MTVTEDETKNLYEIKPGVWVPKNNTRGPLDLEQRIADLTRQVDERDKRIKELTDKVRKAEAMRRPLDTMDEIAYRELEKENTDLKYDNKLLAKQVEDKVEEVKALKMKLELLDNKT